MCSLSRYFFAISFFFLALADYSAAAEPLIEPPMADNLHPDRYCVHQVTLMQQCDFRQSVEALARAGIGKTAVWRDKLDAIGV